MMSVEKKTKLLLQMAQDIILQVMPLQYFKQNKLKEILLNIGSPHLQKNYFHFNIKNKFMKKK